MPAQRVLWLQHVPFEGLGSIEPWLRSRDYTLQCCPLYAGQALPAIDSFDWLIVMGGPMNVDDEQSYPWLAAEKRFIKRALHAGKRTLGICLGAQLMARALGAEVLKGDTPEIGWLPVDLTKMGAESGFLSDVPRVFDAFHWHGDRFNIPEGAIHAAASDACSNQAFIYGERALALQFHLETTAASAAALVHHCGEDISVTRASVQSAEEIMLCPERFDALNQIMASVLSRLAEA